MWVRAGWIESDPATSQYSIDLGLIIFKDGLDGMAPGSRWGNLGFRYDITSPFNINNVYLVTAGYPAETLSPMGRFVYYKFLCKVNDPDPNDGLLVTRVSDNPGGWVRSIDE